jgi:GR25 family glycosyltransferase involved in LPS biosynthesis
MSITFIALVLDKDSERLKIFNENLKVIPDLKLYKSVDGFDIEETKRTMVHEKLKYSGLAPPGMHKNPEKLKSHKPKWGTLACWLTKYKALKWQIQNKIPYLCFIEDDLLLLPDFQNFCLNQINMIKPGSTDIIRLGKWGEAYITSFESAKNVLFDLYKNGIIMPIDDQLRIHSKEYATEKKNVPWLLAVKSGNGPRAQTKFIDF